MVFYGLFEFCSKWRVQNVFLGIAVKLLLERGAVIFGG